MGIEGEGYLLKRGKRDISSRRGIEALRQHQERRMSILRGDCAPVLRDFAYVPGTQPEKGLGVRPSAIHELLEP
jgi:hypothetical protein